MKKHSIETQKLHLKAETSLNKRSQLEQGIEARTSVSPTRGNTLQKGKSKGHEEVQKDTIFLVSRSFKLIIFIYVF